MTSVDRLESQSPVTVVDSTALFEKALNSWSAIDLSSLQKELDSKALEIQDYQKESLLGRKELATQTKDFKKLTDEEKLENFNQLLKSYQNVIDSINKKNKNVETLFFKVYRSIAEAPDPKPLLKASLENIASTSEIEKIKEENRILEEKLLKVADYDKLKEQIEKTETQMKAINEAQIKATENEWQSLLEEKENNWAKDEKEKAAQFENLRRQIQEHELNEKMLKLKLKKKIAALGEDDDDEGEEEVDQVKKLDENYKEDGSSATSTEIENLKNDLSNSQKRVKSLEKRNEELRREVSSLGSSIDIEIQKTRQENNKRISNLEGENSLLIAKLEYERKASTSLRKEIDTLKTNFSRETKQLSFEIDELKKFKDAAGDYEETKKELEILKQIQFGDEDEATDVNTGSNASSVSKLESAIVQRNKKLNNDLTELRRQNEENVEKINALSAKINSYEKEIKSLKDSNSILENDLMNFDSNGGGNGSNDRWETMSMISSIAGGQSHGKVSPAASIAGGNDNNSTLTVGNAADASLLPIITQQRDRFRNRNKELEEENKKHFSKVIELKREINTLKNDNRELYEKIRFLEYHQTNKNSISQGNGDIESRYRSEYENDLHPIEQFRIMETKRINSNITPWDRIFIQVTRSVLSTSYTRWLFVVYCLSLHLLVMVLTLSMLGSSAAVVETSSPLGGGPGTGSLTGASVNKKGF